MFERALNTSPKKMLKVLIFTLFLLTLNYATKHLLNFLEQNQF